MPRSVDQNSPAKSHRPKPKLRCRAQGEMAQWLAASGGSLAITTYTSGKLVLVSSFDNRLRFRTLPFTRPMGIAHKGNHLAMAVREKILLFRKQKNTEGTFALQQEYATGKVDAHDLAFGERRIYFANTRYNSIARVSKKKRFLHCWQPPFIEDAARGDRCHLNGLAVRDDQPQLATAFCETGHKGGWREQNRFTDGVLIDIPQNKVVARGLCMPHSPRWHAGQWWLCNSGLGELSTFDPQSGKCTKVCSLPGFTRGLCFVGDYALVGLSKIRRKHILDAPPVRDRHKKISAGAALVHLPTRKHVGLLEFREAGREVFDVVFLPGILRPGLML